MTTADNTFHSAFGDDDPEPRGRPLECTICGSGGHNRSLCPWAVEVYRIPDETRLRILSGMQNMPRKPPTLAQARAMQNAHPPFLEELAAHLEGQEAPKPTPQPEPLSSPDLLSEMRQNELSRKPKAKQFTRPPSRLQRLWRALKTVLTGSV